MDAGPLLYPVGLVLAGRRCLVVGGGRVAIGKVDGLLDVGADVTVVAPEVAEEIASRPVSVERRPYRRGEVAGYRLVVAATGDPAVNAAVFEDGEAGNVLVNAADDPAHCSCLLPSRFRRGPVTVTVSTAGRSPALAAWLRRRLEEEIGPEYGTLAELLGEARAGLRRQGISTEEVNWQAVLDSGMLERIREGDLAGAKERLQACLSSSSA